MFSFAGALRNYGHSSEVRSKCINVIATSDHVDLPTNIEELHETLIRLIQSQNPTADGTPHIKDPVAPSAASVMRAKIKKCSKG